MLKNPPRQPTHFSLMFAQACKLVTNSKLAKVSGVHYSQLRVCSAWLIINIA